MMRTIKLTGARGGHGTTTVAAALALYASEHGTTTLVTDVPSTAALIGVALPFTENFLEVTDNLVISSPETAAERPHSHTVVIDATTAQGARERTEHYLVLRGPCYVALATLLAAPHDDLDGIILVAEPKRSLTARDVTDVLDVPVIATIDVTSNVARTIDAGLLVSRLSRLREFAPLRALATDPFAGRLRPSTAHPRQTISNPCETHTDLPLTQCVNGAEGRACVKRVALSPSRPYVDLMWSDARLPSSRVEHRPARARRRGLLHR